VGLSTSADAAGVAGAAGIAAADDQLFGLRHSCAVHLHICSGNVFRAALPEQLRRQRPILIIDLNR
jgi:hypothetical protein